MGRQNLGSLDCLLQSFSWTRTSCQTTCASQGWLLQSCLPSSHFSQSCCSPECSSVLLGPVPLRITCSHLPAELVLAPIESLVVSLLTFICSSDCHCILSSTRQDEAMSTLFTLCPTPCIYQMPAMRQPTKGSSGHNKAHVGKALPLDSEVQRFPQDLLTTQQW
jgi:hypothetical protein